MGKLVKPALLLSDLEVDVGGGGVTSRAELRSSRAHQLSG